MEQIRKAEPSKLFIGADGPREDHPGDKRNCQQARDVATRVDWDCEVHTLFRDENLGCKQAVSSAITWFFEHVEAGIILEDDCVPHPTFFPYCAELLERYREDKRIMTIGGNNFQPDSRKYQGSYYFSGYMHCWGWATWRRSWECYEGGIPAWSDLRGTSWLQEWLGTETEAQYWTNIFDRVAEGRIDSWAYPWTFSCWREHGLNILPETNLVSNIGFGERSTHTNNPDDEAAHMDVKGLSLPLEHPQMMTRHYEADRHTSAHHYGIGANSLPWHVRMRRAIPGVIKAPFRPLVSHLRN
ncbi:hypothetical protein [Salinibacter ruber]|uniref:hypothetical protein n=1 Tax=Salinibacter ruber TaxID=146919 RepID=UPI0021675794|nr:hypothetical protein [Salinibacter ruber]